MGGHSSDQVTEVGRAGAGRLPWDWINRCQDTHTGSVSKLNHNPKANGQRLLCQLVPDQPLTTLTVSDDEYDQVPLLEDDSDKNEGVAVGASATGSA